MQDMRKKISHNNAGVSSFNALTDQQIGEQIEDVLEQLRPYFMMHGGEITYDHFVRETGEVFVKLSGNCGGCPSSSYTLKLLVESELKKEVPQVQKVVELDSQ